MDGSNYQAILRDVAVSGPAGELRLGEPRLAASPDMGVLTSAPMSELPRYGLLQRLAHPLCVATAAAAHLAIAAILLAGKAHDFGESGTALEAIAVDVVEMLQSQASPSQAGSDGSAGEAVDEVRDETPPAPVPVPKQIEPEVLDHPVVADAALAIAPPPKPREPDIEPEARPAPVVEPPLPPIPPAPAQAATSATIAVGEASPGVVNAYGAELSRIISRGRPRGRETANLKGTVVVEFVVGLTGGLERADVRKSSGNARLDDLGLTALRRLNFPVPAPDMSAKQRTFTVPFVYR